MTFENTSSLDQPDAFRVSKYWDIYIPIAIAAVPAALFALLGLLTKGLDKPAANVEVWVVIPMIVLQTLGIIAMAIVILIRVDVGRKQLLIRTGGSPAVWRKVALALSILFILLFDVVTNVAAAFAGAGPLLVIAVPAFAAYLLCLRVAFVRL